jgi:hypothetical protein
VLGLGFPTPSPENYKLAGGSAKKIKPNAASEEGRIAEDEHL